MFGDVGEVDRTIFLDNDMLLSDKLGELECP